MRVIAGSARGRPLRPPKNAPTRPTADYVKEALFSMIESLLAWGRSDAEIGTPELWEGLRVVDAYAGSGALGIEALSRGAAHATFLESNAAAVAAIRANLAAAGLAEQALIRPGDARQTTGSIAGPIDLVLMDPPYQDPAVLDVAEQIATSGWLAGSAILALEHGQRLAAPPKLGTLKRQRARRHGDTVLTLYARGDFDREGGE